MTSLIVPAAVSPRYLSLPVGAPSPATEEAVRLAGESGLILDEHQRFVLDGACRERTPGKWAAFEVGVIEPRQNGKGSILESREIAGLFLWGERLIIHTAHEFKTAEEHSMRVFALVEENPSLAKRVKHIYRSNSKVELRLTDGARLRFLARSSGSGRGFAAADLLVLDEAYSLSPQMMAAVVPPLSTKRNAQLWYTSSAPLQTEESAVLRKFCRRGREGADNLAYFEWCVDPDDDQADPATWAKANPALGTRIDEEFLHNERVILGDEWARERLGLWVDTDQLGDAAITTEAWNACRDEKSGPVGPVCFALDVSPARTMGAFAVAGAAGKGGVHVEVVDYQPGTAWLVERAKSLHEKWGGRLAVATGSPASSLIVELETAGVPVFEVPPIDHAAACGRFFDHVADRTLRHLGQLWLDEAITGAAKKFYGDAWLWGRRQSSGDISPLVASTLALWAHEQTPPVDAGFVDLSDFVED